MQVRDINIQCNIKQFMYRQMKTKKLSVCVYVCVSKMFYFNVIFLGGGGLNCRYICYDKYTDSCSKKV